MFVIYEEAIDVCDRKKAMLVTGKRQCWCSWYVRRHWCSWHMRRLFKLELLLSTQMYI
jgi:hypothetical protein